MKINEVKKVFILYFEVTLCSMILHGVSWVLIQSSGMQNKIVTGVVFVIIQHGTMGHFFLLSRTCSMENFLWPFKFDVMTLVISNL